MDNKVNYKYNSNIRAYLLLIQHKLNKYPCAYYTDCGVFGTKVKIHLKGQPIKDNNFSK